LNLVNGKDTVKVYLRETNSPYNIIDSASRALDTINFSNVFSFYNSVSGSYYIEIKHDQCTETWSRSGGEVLTNDSNIYNYDFTFTDSQAFGNNLIQKGFKFCLYSGEINNDGFINLDDMLTIYNDAAEFKTGNIRTDLTGDKLVDLNDILIVFNNAVRFVSVIRP